MQMNNKKKRENEKEGKLRVNTLAKFRQMHQKERGRTVFILGL